MGSGVTPEPRPYAWPPKDRGFVYQPTLIKGNKPITIGHQYSTVALLPEKDQARPVPWVVPLSVQRVKVAQKKAETSAEQMSEVLDRKSLPFDQTLCVEVGDAITVSLCIYLPIENTAISSPLYAVEVIGFTTNAFMMNI